MREIEHAEEQDEDRRQREPSPHRPEGNDEAQEAEDSHDGSGRNGLWPVVLPLHANLLDVLQIHDEVHCHQQPATKAGEADVEEEAAGTGASASAWAKMRISYDGA